MDSPPTTELLPSASEHGFSPHSDDDTVLTSNVSCSLLDNSKQLEESTCHTGDTVDDFDSDTDSEFDSSDQGRVKSVLVGAIDASQISWLPSADVVPDPSDATPEPDAPSISFDPDADRAQLDTGTWASCTCYQRYLHNYVPFTKDNPSPIRLEPATEGSDAVPVGYGYLHVKAGNSQGYLAIRTFFTPQLRTTVIDERDFARAAGCKPEDFESERIIKYPKAGTFTFHSQHRLRRSQDIVVHGVLIDGKCYTDELILPDLASDHPQATSDTSSAFNVAHDPEFAEACRRATVYNIYAWQEAEYAELRDELKTVPVGFHSLPFHEYIQKNTPVAAIKAATERLLWHQRLGHPSDYYLYNAHKHIDGVPQFKHMDRVLDTCPTCIRAKQTKEPAGPNSTRTATQPYQGLSVDFSFSGTKSKDTTRSEDYLGLNGETAWILVTDHFAGRKHGDTRINKASPLHWLKNFLQNHSPNCPGKYVYLDQGGELYNNPEIVRLFKRFGYDVRPTGAEASNQNGPVERAHLSVANAIRSMLLGQNLPVKFWPYAFHHWLRIDQSIPSRDQTESPLKMSTGKVDDFSAFRTFGCRVWVRPPGRRRAKFIPNSRKGIFLGFLPNTTRNIVWYDVETEKVKIAKHARFDEGMNDLPTDQIPPNVIHLQRTQDGQPFPPEPTESSVEEFHFTTNPFSHTFSKPLRVRCTSPTFGMTVKADMLNNRAYVGDIRKNSSTSKIFSSHKATCNKIRGAYIVSINHQKVFTQDDALRILKELFDAKVTRFDIEFAPEKRLDAKHLRKALLEHDLFKPNEPEEEHVPTLSIDAIRAIAAIRHPEEDFSDPTISNEIISTVINAIRSNETTSDEQALGHFTRRKLRKLDTWEKWQDGERTQLDHFHALGMYGKPTKPPPNAIILRPHWQYHIKRDGTRRSRNCCDGSRRSAPVLHKVSSTYSSCVEQPVQRLFFALSAALGYQVYGGDAVDAFAHSPPPETPTFIRIDDAYFDWYKYRFGIELDRSQVLPVLHALQGHPESGRLWEEHINKILRKIGFKNTTHDRSIYSGVFNGIKVLLLRQVDDFAMACPHEALAEQIFQQIGEALRLPSEQDIPLKYFGLLKDYNGIDVTQTSTTCELSCETYIKRVLKSHSWETCSSSPTKTHTSPLPTDAITPMFESIGPPEGSPAHAVLVEKYGFAYRTLLGELLYAYITCRPDIGYAVVTLSKFASCPDEIHFALLRKVAKYLRETANWALIYHKPTENPALPKSLRPPLAADLDLGPFPKPSSLLEPVCCVDAAHANDLRNRRSTTGFGIMLAGGAISYRCKTQSITATSSTEAEFIAAVLAAKQVRYLRFILKELGFPLNAPTPVYMDNMSAINMINSKVPTERSRHIDIQYFAVQDWKDSGALIMKFIPGVLNPSDDLTKPLGWVLHARHARRLMGHYHPLH